MDNSIIPVSILFPEIHWDTVKIHVAQKAGKKRPIDAFTRDFEEWQEIWNGSFHSNHCWNRDLIFSMIELPNQPNRWLFGGIFNVNSHKRGKNRNGKQGVIYSVSLSSEGNTLIGRLVISWTKDGRAKGRKPASMLPNMTVAEILPELYAGEDFPGYSNINHAYSTLEKLWKDCKSDWLAALTNCQGVYLITDTKTGRRYVGSAYGGEGIWSRWNTYFSTGGHGNNKLLRNLLNSKLDGLSYARNHFRFSLLEQASSRDSEQHIIQRESYWKDVLMTRSKFGLNEN